MTSTYDSWEAACAAADAEHHHQYRHARGGMECPCGDRITPEARPDPQVAGRCSQCGRTQSADDWDLAAHALMFRFERDLARHQLALVRQVAESLGDRTGPADARSVNLPPRGAARYSDRRLMEPLKRMLLEILDAEGSQA